MHRLHTTNFLISGLGDQLRVWQVMVGTASGVKIPWVAWLDVERNR